MHTTLRRTALPIFFAMIAILAVASCSSGDPVSSSPTTAASNTSKTVTIHIKGYAFTPAIATVAKGSKVTFVNDDKVVHTAKAGDGAFDTGSIDPGKSKTVTIKASATGSIAYICAIHQFMKGTIKVAG